MTTNQKMYLVCLVIAVLASFADHYAACKIVHLMCLVTVAASVAMAIGFAVAHLITR